ncbi:MAG: hypothetical protein DPW14_09815 [Planctomycetes bacterium]|nr:hypothetical protein [Planctomycetota bacterium]
MNLNHTLDQATVKFDAAPQAVRATLCFAGSEFFFEGHFPGDPIVPAVIQIDIALRLAGRALGRTLALREVTRAVFKQPVGPGQELNFDIELRPAEQDLTRIKCGISSGGNSIAEFALRAC